MCHCAVHGGLSPPRLSAWSHSESILAETGAAETSRGRAWDSELTHRPPPGGTPRLPAPVLPRPPHQSGEQLLPHPEPCHSVNTVVLASLSSDYHRSDQPHPGSFSFLFS